MSAAKNAAHLAEAADWLDKFRVGSSLEPHRANFAAMAASVRDAGKERSELRGIVNALFLIGLNGTVCTPPYTWADPFLGGDGSGSMFDVEAMKCPECKALWRRVERWNATRADGSLSALNVAADSGGGGGLGDAS